MKYLPCEEITYHTNYTKDEIKAIINNNIGEDLSFWSKMNFEKSDKIFFGNLYDNTFLLKRNINYRNSFLPDINGKIIELDNKTAINITLDLNAFVLMFLIVYSIVCILFILIIIFLANKDIQVIIFPIFMLLFMYVMTLVSFKYESKKTKKILKELFNAEIINEK